MRPPADLPTHQWRWLTEISIDFTLIPGAHMVYDGRRRSILNSLWQRIDRPRPSLQTVIGGRSAITNKSPWDKLSWSNARISFMFFEHIESIAWNCFRCLIGTTTRDI